MKRWHYFIIVTLILAVALSALVFYINRTLIPVKLKDIFEQNAAQQLQKKVTIGKLGFSITRGFVLQNVIISEDDGGVLFKADSLSSAVILLPSLKNLNIIIPRLAAHNPYLNLKRLQDGTLNISSILKKDLKQKKPSYIHVTIKSAVFDGGTVSFADSYEGRDFKRTLTTLKGYLGLSLPNDIAVSCSAKIENTPLKVILRYKPLKKVLMSDLEIKDLALPEYWNTYLASILPVGRSNLRSGISDISLKTVISNFQDIKVNGSLNIRHLEADINKVTVAGDYKLDGNITFTSKKPSSTTYKLSLEFNKANIITDIKPLRAIKDIKGEVLLTEKEWLFKKLACSLYGSPAHITGTVRAPHDNFVADIALASTLYLSRISDITNIGFEDGKAKIDTKITYKKDKAYQLSGTSQIEGLKLRQKDIIISGDFYITAKSWGSAADWEAISYEGAMNFNNSTIEGIGLLPLISGASGEASFNAKQLTIKKLAGNAADTKITLSCTMDYKEKEPNINLSLKTAELSLSKFLVSLPEDIRARFKDISVDGLCSINLLFSGKIGRPDTYNYAGKISLKNGELGLPYWPHNVGAVDCDLDFEKQKVTWQNLLFNIKDVRYTSYGKIVNFAQPDISVSLKSQDLDLVAEVNTDADKITNVGKLNGRFRNSTFSLSGKVSDLKTLYANLAGSIFLDLRDIPYIFDSQEEALLKLKPHGVIKFAFDMRGPLKEIDNWTLFTEGSSEAIYVGDLKLKDFYLDYRMKDRFIDIPVIVAYPYDGIINISSRTNLKTKERPYIINIDIKDVDLSKLIQDTEFKNKKIKGIFTAKSVLNGYLSQKGSLQGSGWLQVSDGYLWAFPVISGIFDFMGMIDFITFKGPEYITLTDAFGNFAVSDSRIYTDDFKMLSKKASLLWEGSLGFDGTLDFGITGGIEQDVTKQTSEPGKIVGRVVDEVGRQIMEIRLTGTLAEPRYQLLPFAGIKKIFKKLTEPF